MSEQDNASQDKPATVPTLTFKRQPGGRVESNYITWVRKMELHLSDRFGVVAKVMTTLQKVAPPEPDMAKCLRLAANNQAVAEKFFDGYLRDYIKQEREHENINQQIFAAIMISLSTASEIEVMKDADFRVANDNSDPAKLGKIIKALSLFSLEHVKRFHEKAAGQAAGKA